MRWLVLAVILFSFASVQAQSVAGFVKKEVFPVGTGTDGIISQRDTLMFYGIRFQNTGTDTAFNIIIRDTLDGDLDYNSFAQGTASHQYTVTFEEDSILVFTFLNIMLPDSNVDEAASLGNVTYWVKHRGTLPLGTVLSNRAAVYFDLNAPVITNTVTNKIGVLDYHPFPMAFAKWNVLNYHKEGGPSGYTCLVGGDTIVNGRRYSMVRAGNTLVGAIREDSTRKVYLKVFLESNTAQYIAECLRFEFDTLEEVVLYDFGLETGDTSYFFDPVLFPQHWDCYQPRVVTAIDSILVFGEYRKRYWITGGALLGDRWIEGIGSEAGLFAPYAAEFENSWSLCSFKYLDQTWVNPAPFSCYTGVEERENSASVSIYPNPAHAELYIEVAYAGDKFYELEIVNILGTKMLLRQIEKSATLTDLHFPPGIYWVQVKSKGNILAVKKISIF